MQHQIRKSITSAVGSLPRLARWFGGLASLACLAGSVAAGTFYVSPTGDNDAGDGSAEKPWATIDHGDSASLLTAGDIVVVRAGLYQPPSTGVVLANNSGATGLPITYRAEGSVVLDLAGNPGSFGFDIKASGLALEGFEIRGASHGIRVDRGADIQITGCTIHDSARTDSSGIWVSSANGVTMVRNVIYNIHSSGDTPWGNLGAGLRHQASQNITFWHNLIDNAHVGILWYGETLGNPNGGTITVQNCIIVNCTGWGAANPWQTSPAEFTVDHNLVWRNAIDFGNFPAGRNGPIVGDVAGVDPLFAFPSRHDYHLLDGSPVLEAGVDLGFAYEGTAPDLGPYEGSVPPPPIGIVSGRVTANLPGSPPLRGATVRTADGSLSVPSDTDGRYVLSGVPAGVNVIQVNARGFAPAESSVNVVAGDTTRVDFNLAPSAQNQTYHVDAAAGDDANPGTITRPWKSIANGDARGILNPGDTVVVHSGRYPQTAEGVRLIKQFGYGAHPITYRTEGAVLLDSAMVSGETYGFYVGVSGLRLIGFEVKGAQHGVYLAPGSHDCVVRNFLIHDASAVGRNAEGIFVDRSDNVVLTGNVIYNITDAAHAAWSPVGCGIRIQGGDQVQVLNNTIDRAFLGIFYYGGGGFGAGPFGRITTYNNIVVRCGGWGFVNPWSTDATKFSSANNLILGNAIDYGNFPAGNNGPLPSDVSGVDPRFLDEGAHDYHLANDSPALNAGRDAGLGMVGCSADIGAFESDYNPPPKTYYVDSVAGDDAGPGTYSQPWASIGNGDSKGLLHPGDTVVVRSGVYLPSTAEGVKLTKGKGTPTCPITYQAEGKVILQAAGIAGATYGFHLGGRGVQVRGFEIEGFSHGVYVAPGSDDCVVDSCLIHDGVAGGASDWTDGVWVDRASNVTVSRNVIYNFNAGEDAPWGHLGSGVRIQGADRLQLLNNTIDNAYVGVFYFGGTGPGGGPYGTVTTLNNIVVNCQGWGFANPWSLRAEDFTNGHNLTMGNRIAFGNYPARNDAPVSSDVVGDPLFVDPSSGDYHLQAESPALDKGRDVGLPFAGLAPEIGALEVLDGIDPVRVQVERADSRWVLRWDGPSQLQSARELTGSWQTLTGARSPLPVAPEARQQFYRLVAP